MFSGVPADLGGDVDRVIPAYDVDDEAVDLYTDLVAEIHQLESTLYATKREATFLRPRSDKHELERLLGMIEEIAQMLQNAQHRLDDQEQRLMSVFHEHKPRYDA